MKRMIPIILCTILMSISQSGPAGNSAVEAEDWVKATLSFMNELNEFDELSLAIVITKDTIPVLEKAYGLADRSFDVPNRIDTKFNIASMNKMFTAVALVQLIQQGKIRLDQKVGELMPEYPNEEVKTGVTVYQLLTHTAGMGNIFGPRYGNTPVHKFQKVEDYLPLFVEDPLRFEPGSAYEYSNAGYILLGLLIEKVSGQDYFGYVKEHVYHPADMRNTDCYDVQYPIANLASGYSRTASRSEEYEYKTTDHMKMTKGGPAGGGYSTVHDLVKFGEALFGHKLLNERYTKLMTSGKVTVDDLPQGGKYCFGLFEQVLNGHRIVGHSGNLSGIRSTLKKFVDDGISIALLSNFDRDQGAEELDCFIQEKITGPTDYTKTYLKTSELVRTAVLKGHEAAAKSYDAMRDDFELSEDLVSYRANRQLARRHAKKAIEILRFNAYAFPNSINANEQLAEAFKKSGDTKNAIFCYEKLLKLDPENKNAKETLDKMKSELEKKKSK